MAALLLLSNLLPSSGILHSAFCISFGAAPREHAWDAERAPADTRRQLTYKNVRERLNKWPRPERKTGVKATGAGRPHAKKGGEATEAGADPRVLYNWQS